MTATTPNDPTSASQPDIEQLIYAIAEHARDEDYIQLYQNLVNRELFIPIDKESLTSIPEHLSAGETFQTDDSTSIKIRNVEGPRNEAMVPLATKVSLPIVAGAHVGISWLEALAMVLKIDDVSGILLQGETSWIFFYKPQIENILKTYS